MRKFTVQPSQSIKCFTNMWDLDDKSLEEYENKGERYVELESKMVPDIDGFMTDYTMYKDNVTGNYVFVFGDKDVYRPQDGSFDWECDSEKEAYDWFYSYSGIADEDDDEDVFSDTQITEGEDEDMIEWFNNANSDVIDASWTDDGNIIVTLNNSSSDVASTVADLIRCIQPHGYHVIDWNVNGSNVFIFEVISSDEYAQLSEEDDYFTSDEPLSIDGFMDMFEITVDLDIREKAAEILYRWYTLEGEDTMPTREDVLDMCDAATSKHEKSIVLKALDEV